LLVKPSGRRIWLVRNRDNHYLDAEVNALAAALTLQVQSLQPPREAASSNIPTSARQNIQPGFSRPRRGLF
jgi:hypothetical protein